MPSLHLICVQDTTETLRTWHAMCSTTFCLPSRRLHIKTKPHQLYPSQIGCLSLEVVTCLLEQMPALILFFKKLASEDHVPAALLEKLSNPSTKFYLASLEYVLPIFHQLL